MADQYVAALVSFLISCIFIYLVTKLIIENRPASWWTNFKDALELSKECKGIGKAVPLFGVIISILTRGFGSFFLAGLATSTLAVPLAILNPDWGEKLLQFIDRQLDRFWPIESKI